MQVVMWYESTVACQCVLVVVLVVKNDARRAVERLSAPTTDTKLGVL